MTRLTDAVDAVEARKESALGTDQSGLVTGDNGQSRAIFSGFDIDFDELTEMTERVAIYYNAAVQEGMMGIRPLFSSAYIEGMLVGLMLAKLP